MTIWGVRVRVRVMWVTIWYLTMNYLPAIIRENKDALARCCNLKRNAVAKLFADEIARATPV